MYTCVFFLEMTICVQIFRIMIVLVIMIILCIMIIMTIMRIMNISSITSRIPLVVKFYLFQEFSLLRTL